jgi:hypothetical protein
MSSPPKKGVSLADVPSKPVELEEYVAALFQATRYFVEKNIIEKEPTANILELDAVVTSYEAQYPDSIIVEAKSGAWGFADIFKLAGWMLYLELDRGAFFASKEIEGKDSAIFQGKCKDLDISFVHLADFKKALKPFEEGGFPAITDEKLVDLWRLSYWAERNLLDRLRAQSKSNANLNGPKAILEYLHLINNGIFFTDDIRARLRELYAAYQTHPKLALGVAIEQGGGAYDPSAVDPTNYLIREAMRTGNHLGIQTAFYAERRARLAILKTAVDHECAVEKGDIPQPKMPQMPFGMTDLSYWVLPNSFREGLDTLKGHAAFKRYPLFWQVFLWGFGGFYLNDRTEIEFAWLSEQTGVPVGEVPNALQAFDILFPYPNGGSWFATPGPTHATRVKMMPFPMCGLGALQRRLRYGVEDYYKLGYADHTGDDLVRWHNSLVDVLS